MPAKMRSVRTDLFIKQGRRFDVTTVQRGGGFEASWICCECGQSEAMPASIATREESQQKANTAAWFPHARTSLRDTDCKRRVITVLR
jgi:hypothetical protein